MHYMSTERALRFMYFANSQRAYCSIIINAKDIIAQIFNYLTLEMFQPN